MRLTVKQSLGDVITTCPPGCWMCEAERSPATPLGVALLTALAARWRRRVNLGVGAAGEEPARLWPHSAWWEEAVG